MRSGVLSSSGVGRREACLPVAAGGRAAWLARSSVARRLPAEFVTHASATESSPLVEQQQQPDADAASRCPFLAALPDPPRAHNQWWQRLQQLFEPESYQAAALGSDSIVAAPGELSLPPQIVVGTADGVRAVFAGEADGSTTVAPAGIGAGRGLLGDHSLLVQPEPRHKYLRTLIMPAFSTEAIERLVPRMTQVLGRYLQSWADASAGAPAGSLPVKAHDQLRHMTFDFIVAVVLGIDYPPATVQRLSGLYARWARGLLAWPFLDIPFTPFADAMRAKRELLAFFQAEIDAAREALAAGQHVPGILGSLVSAVDEHGNRLTDAEIGDNLLLIMLAGHDTSSTTLTHVLAELHQHPEVVAKLREEQAQLVARHGPAINGRVLAQMSYADAVIRETLRLHNIVAGLMRSAARDMQLGGYRVPAGTILYLPLTHLALNDPRWADDEPAAFRPERMLTPDGLKPGALLPFGHGPRHCAGYAVAMAEMKCFLALLARGYSFEADTATRWVQEVGKKPANGLPMRVSRLPQH